jgi:Glycosyl Hydrolase Family 88
LGKLTHTLYHSWELGTRAQALLELSSPEFSVFTPPLKSSSSLPFPPPPSSLTTSQNVSLVDVLNIARSVISSNNGNEGGWEPLMGGDGSAGDPASVGIAVLLANWTQQQQDDEDYARAATAQVDYLLGPKVPKTTDGAISHRVDQLQLWYAPPPPGGSFSGSLTVCITNRSDFVYMVPPFLAYYGLTTGNQSMMQEAYNQVRFFVPSLKKKPADFWQ